MKNENYYSIQDAFKSLDVLLEEKQEAVFSVNSVKEMEEADQFLKDVENSEELEVIVDPEAVDEEDLKDSYVGYVILRCNTCGTPIFKPEEEIRFEEEVFDADGEKTTEVEEKTDIVVNEEDECPHCHNTDGYTIVGKVAPFEKPEEETIKEEEPEVEEPIEEPQEPTPDIDAEEVEEKEEVEESLKEDIDISKLNTDKVIEWISDHDDLYSDFKDYFDYTCDENSGKETNKPAIEDIVDWLNEHNEAWKDFKSYFHIEEKEEVNESLNAYMSYVPSKDYKEKIVNGYVIGKDAYGHYTVYNNEGHFEVDKNNCYETEEEAIERAKSLKKGIAIEVEESCKLKESDEEKIWIVYGDKEKDARANKPVQINKKDLDQYKEVYHFVEVVDNLDSLEEAKSTSNTSKVQDKASEAAVDVLQDFYEKDGEIFGEAFDRFCQDDWVADLISPHPGFNVSDQEIQDNYDGLCDNISWFSNLVSLDDYKDYVKLGVEAEKAAQKLANNGWTEEEINSAALGYYESETPAIQFADIQNDSALYNQEGEEGIIRAIVALYDKHYGDPEWDQAWKNYQATYRNPMDEYEHFADTDSIREKLAEYVSDYIYTEEGGCGPMGGEKPEVSGDRLALESQGPTEVYEFYDDGKIRLINLDSLVFSSDWNNWDDPLEIYDTWNIAMTPEELIDNGFSWWQFKNPEKFLAGYNRILHDDWYNDDDYVLDEAKKQKEPKPLPKRSIEKECEVCPNCEEEKTLNENKVAFDTLNAENVNTLINKYLKETYDNVDIYELKSINNDNAKYYCEGVIKFKSGKEKASRFIFENAKYLTRGKVVLNGLNETFSKSSKAFQLKGTIQENIFNAESLTYQYNAKNLNESVKVFGKVKN